LVARTGLMIAAPEQIFAQATKPPAFEVASIRRNVGGANGGSLSRSGGRMTLDNISLRECIAFAYGIATGRDYELSGPGWLDAEKFDMVATFPAETPRDRVREMLRTLLAERFELKTHTENRRLASYALVVGKQGPKLRMGTVGSDGDGSFTFGEDHVMARAISTTEFADRLSGSVFKLGRPVADMTGLRGVYDFTLNWAPDSVAGEGRSGASLFTALPEQLGLRLEARKMTFRIVVVDHADRIPKEN
jgi:uncharacterized protein (TIGR03435 family)